MPHFLLHKDHELPETLFEIPSEGSGNYVALIAVVKVQGEGRDSRPIRIREVVVAVDATIEVAALPMVTKTAPQLARYPHVYIATIDQKHTQLRAKDIGLDNDISELNLGYAGKLIAGAQARSFKESNNRSRSASKWSNSK